MAKLNDNIFKKNGESWRILDRRGRVVKSLGTIDAYPLLSVLVVKQNGLYGLIGMSGEIVQPCVYRNICQPFKTIGGNLHEVLELTDLDDRLWLADKNGNIVTSRSYREIATGSYTHDLHVLHTWNGFADLFDYDDQYKHQKNGLFDMVNVREILPAIYEPGVPDFGDTMGIYSIGIPVFHREDGEMHCKLINAQGEDLIPFAKGFTSIGMPQRDEYLIEAERNGKWGYINIDGVEKIPFKYDYAGSFTDGYAIVGFKDTDGTGPHYGVIAHHNQIIIPFMFRFPPKLEISEDAVLAVGDNKDFQEVSCRWERE